LPHRPAARRPAIRTRRINRSVDARLGSDGQRGERPGGRASQRSSRRKA